MTHKKNRKILRILFTICLLWAIGNGYAQSSKAVQPNLIVIHTDEHNFRTLSCYREQMPDSVAYAWGQNAGVKTPNIDRIAHEGVICNNYYASYPVCTPSRASMISGLYPVPTGAYINGLPLNDDVRTFAHVLKQEGYATSYLGKWHLEGGKEKYKFGIERNFGFDDNRYMFSNGHGKYFLVKGDEITNVPPKKLNALSAEDKKDLHHVTDFLTDKALEILERDKEKPFCMMISIPDPHTPDLTVSPYDSLYENLDFQAPKTMLPQYRSKRPVWAKLSGNNEAKEFDKRALVHYFGMVHHIDLSVGRILQYLDDNNLAENTIVVFTSDHGDLFFEHGRRNKDMPYEASAKIPYVMRYPNGIIKGKVINKAYSNVDFVPTILGLMGVKNKGNYHGDDTSKDFLSKDKKVVDDKRTVYFSRADRALDWGWIALADTRFKLVLSNKDEPWLFDLQEDPDEIINYYNEAQHKNRVKKMERELLDKLVAYGDTVLLSKEDLILGND